jgi:histidinol-phosphatase (PHP family)
MEHGPYTPLEYSREWLEQFLDIGRSRQVTGLGIVEHGYRFTESAGLLPGDWAARRCLYPLRGYTKFLDEVRHQYPIAVGLEMDYVPASEEGIRAYLNHYSWDFILGSVHFIDDFGLDVGEMRDEYTRRDPEDIWSAYYQYSIKAAQSGLFQVITHPDLPKIYGFPKPPDSVLVPWYHQFVEALGDNHVALEINTAGLRRPVKEIYPHPRLLLEAARAHLPVTLASDAHEPENVGRFFDEARNLALECGIEAITAFTARGVQTISLR